MTRGGLRGLDVPDAEALLALPAPDRALLHRSFALARRGWGGVHPNPMVGCVVARDGRVLGEGWHARFGGAHAEVRALEAAARAGEGEVAGATAYVSLEPCSHEGKTPACSTALLAAGIGRVIYGVAEPTPVAAGGAAALRDGGVEVVGPVYGEVVGRRTNPAFFHWARHAAPWVALKLAVTLDGRIAARPGVRTRITGAAAHRHAHRLRAGFDAVLVGSGTVRVDDPLLTVRHGVRTRAQPRRIVVAAGAGLDPRSALFDDAPGAPVEVFVREDVEAPAVARLEAAGAFVHRVPGGPEGVALDAVLDHLGTEGVRAVLSEGGATLASTLLREGRVHRLYLFVAPRMLGPGAVPAFVGPVAGEGAGEGWVPAARPRLLGPDALLVYDHAGGTA